MADDRVLDRLDELNDKFDILITAIQDINETLKENKNEAPSRCSCIGCIIKLFLSVIHFISIILSIFNWKFLFTTACFCFYFFQDDINDYFNTNISALMHSVANHIIFPQLAFDAYFRESKPHILALQTTKIQSEGKIISKWAEYEQQYNRYNELIEHQINYHTENIDPSIRQVVLIGPTGSGKSLFANRLSGYQGDSDANGYFQASENMQSCTTKLSKLIVYNLHAVNISVLDTPGIFDSDDRDIVYQHNLINYLQGSNGINSFLLILKKERLSNFIQTMLKDFHQTFGDKFWSHLIFVINFWNERERKNWEKWRESFRNRIREDFNLTNSGKYPLHIVGLNNFGSYKLEIKRDLIPKIPSQRLESDLFVSPMDTFKNDTLRLHEQINDLMSTMAQKQQKINLHCTELKYINSWIAWLSPKTIVENGKKIEEIKKVIHEKCNYDALQSAEIVNIQRKLRQFTVVDKDDELRRLESPRVDYQNDNHLFYKYGYFMDGTGQLIINCLNKTNLLRSVDLNSLLSACEDSMITAEMVCNTIENPCCDHSDKVNSMATLVDEGKRFLVL